GRCKTRLAAAIGDAAAARLYAAMIADSIDAYSRAGAKRNVVIAAPEHEGLRALQAVVPRSWEVISQAGGELGERLADAFRALQTEGGAVVLVGSDSSNRANTAHRRGFRSSSRQRASADWAD